MGSQSQVISLRNVIEHLEHAVSITGIDHVGLGSDFDGIAQVPLGLEDATKFPVIIEELLRLGWPESDVKKIMGGNFFYVSCSKSYLIKADLHLHTTASDGAYSPKDLIELAAKKAD